jgi:NodT family efflux transporter outer membrane factor (OMF) lipoprotein
MKPVALTRPVLTLLAASLVLGGCANLAPKYEVPDVDTPAAFKEGEGAWVKAAPADLLERGPWWELFDDPLLDALAGQVVVTNQNVAQAVAAYEQALAITREQRAALFPQVSLDARSNRTGGPDTPTRSSYSLALGATWEPDVFGRLRLGVENARLGEQASAADLAAAQLAAQGQVATNYFGLRQTDVLIALQELTIAGYSRALRITQNRYNAGIVARTDVLQAQTQLANAQADLLSLQQQRGNFEHAVAVLVGRAPADFAIAADPKWSVKVPGLPPTLPSTLLQRRPDIASAERRVAAANASIGIARSGYYPDITLTGSLTSSAAKLGDLFKASNLVWALGSSLAQTVFDAGATAARVDQARAGLNQAAASYRQTVLTAFQQVEDQLLALRILREQQTFRAEASRAADLVEQQTLNQYEVGKISFSDVITAQIAAQAARRALVQAEISRQIAVVALIQGVGGGWTGLGSTTAATP